MTARYLDNVKRYSRNGRHHNISRFTKESIDKLHYALPEAIKWLKNRTILRLLNNHHIVISPSYRNIGDASRHTLHKTVPSYALYHFICIVHDMLSPVVLIWQDDTWMPYLKRYLHRLTVPRILCKEMEIMYREIFLICRQRFVTLLTYIDIIIDILFTAPPRSAAKTKSP